MYASLYAHICTHARVRVSYICNERRSQAMDDFEFIGPLRTDVPDEKVIAQLVAKDVKAAEDAHKQARPVFREFVPLFR